jgi:hypothetical protein
MTISTTPSADPAPPRPDPSPGRGPRLGPYPVRLPKLKDPRLHVASVTMTLQVLGQTVFDFPLSIAQILIAMGTCAAVDLFVVFRRERVIAWPASAMLTGNGIALIMRVPGTEHGDWWSLNGWWVFAGTAALAMASKYLIRSGGRHVFNPSNFALVVAFVVLGETRADPQVLWWGPLSPGLVLAFAVILTGSVLITRRVGQGHSAVSFWVAFAVAVAVIAASGHSITANWHVGALGGWDYWLLLVTSPEILVFVFYMITDPRTAPGGKVAQSVYGVGIAAVAALIIATQSGEFGTKVGILAGLVLLCPFVRPIERHSPVRGADEDSVRVALQHRRVRRLSATAGLVVLASVLVLAHQTGADDRSPLDLSRRSEVTVSPAEVPRVRVDPDAPTAAITLTPELAQAMGADLVHSLAVEAAAVRSADPNLAEAGVSGRRLLQARSTIDAASGEEPAIYEFDEMIATLRKADAGPQTPPELAVQAAGTLTDAQGASRFDHTFTLVQVDGVFLVTGEYDEAGELVGAAVSTNPNAIEAPVRPTSARATPQDLQGLELLDATRASGLELDRSPTPLREGPAALSGGVAVGDVDGDSDDDLFLTGVGRPNALLRNDGGRFIDITAEAGVGGHGGDGGATGATFVDLNGDGHLDLVVLGMRDTPNQLLLGSADGVFSDATAEWGLPTATASDPDAAALSLASADVDRDGRPDLLITESDPYRHRAALEAAGVDGGDPCSTEARAASAQMQPASSRTRLLHNTGTGLVDVTDRLGVDPSSLLATSARFADVDGDGWDDLLIGGAACTTRLLRNDGTGRFGDVTESSGIAELSIDTANAVEPFDADGDGDLDFFIAGVAYPTRSGECPLEDVLLGCSGNHLLINDGTGTFSDGASDAMVADSGWAFGAAAVDLNGDGRSELVVGNGLRTATTELGDANREDPLYRRSADTTGTVWVASAGGGWLDTGLDALAPNSKAVVVLDADVDGRPDLLSISPDGTPRLALNRTGGERQPVAVRLIDDVGADRLATGAVVSIERGDGSRGTHRVSGDASFQGGGTRWVFDSSNGSGPVTVRVRWPDGRLSSYRLDPASGPATLLRSGG